jgi:hypothetical protein
MAATVPFQTNFTTGSSGVRSEAIYHVPPAPSGFTRLVITYISAWADVQEPDEFFLHVDTRITPDPLLPVPTGYATRILPPLVRRYGGGANRAIQATFLDLSGEAALRADPGFYVLVVMEELATSNQNAVIQWTVSGHWE